MIDGMITAPLLSLFVVPAVYLVWKRKYIGNDAPRSSAHPIT